MINEFERAQQQRERAAARAKDPRLTTAEVVAVTPLASTLAEIWALPEAER